MNRREFLRRTPLAVLAAGFPHSRAGAAAPFHSSAGAGAEQAHSELWRRFVDRHGVLVDFCDLEGRINLPTPEECREGKPNALGWFQPIENGAMFNGLYLDAAVNRWRHTRTGEDAAKARRLAEGLILLNSISEVEGFVGRGVSSDGRSHYPMGSNDQTGPWFVGLWRYLDSGLPTPAEADRIRGHLNRTARAIIELDWRMPAEAPYGSRGTFEGFHFEETSRKLFVLKLMGRITGEASWEADYRAELEKRGGEPVLTKRQICAAGMKYYYAKTHAWTSCASVYALRGLWEMEEDPDLKADYAQGLGHSADLASECLPLVEHFDPAHPSAFSQDWRSAMMPLWKPQADEHAAVALAREQLRAFVKVSPRRDSEARFIREPAAAAWIVTLAPGAEWVEARRPGIERVIAATNYADLYYSTFFWVEAAWWRLPRTGN